MNCALIKNFIEEYKNCPLCGCNLYIDAISHNNIDKNQNRFHISTSHDKLTINVESDYFVNTSAESFGFSISIVNGNVLFSDKTNQFVSLYDLDILLFKECQNCFTMGEAFSVIVHLYYDRSISSFELEKYEDNFRFCYDDKNYYFANNFNLKVSHLSVNAYINDELTLKSVATPFIPFDKFDFSSREKLYSKINSIRLLV